VKPQFIVSVGGSEKETVEAGAYIKLIKAIRFAYMYLLNQKNLQKSKGMYGRTSVHQIQ
jgi:hypothetical protein